MKKHLFYLILAATALCSCTKDKSKPVMGNVDERLSATLEAYQKQLTGAQFGWRGYLLSEVPATFLFSFTDKNRTLMSSDYKTTPAESSYRLKALQRPTLLFDSYSILHLIADPTPNELGGLVGRGFSSDFEFAFLSASPDTIRLEGTFNKSKLILVRSKSADENADVFKAVGNIKNAVSKLRTYFKRTTIGNIECEINVDAISQIISFSYLDGANLTTVKSNFYVSGPTIHLYTPLKVGTATIAKLDGMAFDTATGFINVSINGVAIQIKEAIKPLKLDLGAAQRWYNQMSTNRNGCWASFSDAFHANGVDDFCNFKAVPNFYSLWYAGAGVFGGKGEREGIVSFLTDESFASPYAFSKVPFTVNSGIARFTLNANVGSYEGTTPIVLAMTAARNLLYGGGTVGSFEDWYLIPTSDQYNWYDMVRASDAQAWITWRPL